MSSLIDQAFNADDGLRQKIHTTIQSTPTTRPLFEDIAAYHLRYSRAPNGVDASDEPAAKKRKLANGALPIHQADAKCEQVLEVKEVSFSIPQRKKLHFRVVLYTSPAQSSIGVQAVNPASGQVEYELPGSELAQILRLPVPEKATKQFNYLFITRPGSTYEPIVFTVPATPLKAGTFNLPAPATTLEDALSQLLKRHQLTLTQPDENEFASAIPEAHRKSEKAYHVKAFRGSKDGYLFLLANGIFFGFKKPLLFLAFEDIESISYTSVLQRTFNLNVVFRKVVATDGGDNTEEEEIEFSMLDQADFAGINEYVQRHGLNDASLAAGRRAKIEGKKKGVTNSEGAAEGEGDDDGRTELEKAQQQLDDEEEEDDEDFDPDDDEDGDASGSGSESEDDSEDDADVVRKVKGKNLVKDELGSEAEDVEITDDEDGDGEDGEDDEEVEAEPDEDEDMVEVKPEVVSRPAKVVQQQQQPPPPQPATTGRWGAAINSEPDPDDEDQL